MLDVEHGLHIAAQLALCGESTTLEMSSPATETPSVLLFSVKDALSLAIEARENASGSAAEAFSQLVSAIRHVSLAGLFELLRSLRDVRPVRASTRFLTCAFLEGRSSSDDA